MAHHQGFTVASILKNDNLFLKRELDQRVRRIRVPWTQVSRGKKWPLPLEAKFEFFGKDISEPIRSTWETFPWGDQNLTGAQRFDRALGVYDWVFDKKPDALVVWTDAYPETRAACMAMRTLGRPAIEVVHGGFHVYTHGHWEAKAFATHKLGSWEYRAWHKFYGLRGEVIATGLPTMDVWAHNDIGALRAVARKELEIPEVATVVTYLGDLAFERNAWMDPGLVEGALVQFLRDWRTAKRIVPNPHLIFKQHPYDRGHTLEHYRGLVEDLAGITDNYTLIDDNLVLALAPADLLVGPRSTAMVSGLMLGLPSLVVDFTPFFDEYNYRGFGFEIAREPTDVLSKLVWLLTERGKMVELIDQTRRGSAWFSGAQDMAASERAAEAVLAILEGREPDLECPQP